MPRVGARGSSLEGRLGRILTGMKRWYLYLITVPLGLVSLIYLVGLNFSINFADIGVGPSSKNMQRESERCGWKRCPQEVLVLR